MNTDNKFGKCCNCPAMMSDAGRLFTNYLDNYKLNTLVKNKYNIYNNHDYRLTLQKKGFKIIMADRKYFNNKKCQWN